MLEPHVDLGLDYGELVLGGGQLCVGLGQSLPLGRHVAEHLVERHDVHAPRAQTRRRDRLGADEVWLEGGVVLIWPGWIHTRTSYTHTHTHHTHTHTHHTQTQKAT